VADLKRSGRPVEEWPVSAREHPASENVDPPPDPAPQLAPKSESESASVSESESESESEPDSTASAEFPLLHPATVAEWRDWLAANHADSRGAWVAIGKKGNAVTALDYDSAVREALCFGRIDGLARSLDESRYLQRMTPRNRGSDWAPSNTARVAELEREGRLAPAGIQVIERAKSDGSWSALDDIEAMIVPDDLAAALAADPLAQRNFAVLPHSVCKMALYRISKAKRAATRAARIAETVSAAVEYRSAAVEYRSPA